MIDKRQPRKNIVIKHRKYFILLWTSFLLTYACEDSSSDHSSTTNMTMNESGTQTDMNIMPSAGDDAGLMAGRLAGETAGETAGVMAGESAGATAGETAGSQAGAMGTPREQIEARVLDRQVTIPGLSAVVEVIFTEGDIPHIYAENTDDLGRALGFIMGRDRFFTMDLIRRLGTGTLSDLLGELALDVDYESRSIGMTYVADRLNDSMSEKASRYLTAISEGLNAYITAVEAGEMLAPTEYVLAAPLFQSTPAGLMRPWTQIDLAAMAAVILYQTNFETKDLGASDRLASLAAIYPDDPSRRDTFISEVALNQKPPFQSYSATPHPDWRMSLDQNKNLDPLPAYIPSALSHLPIAFTHSKTPQKLTQGVVERLKKFEGWFGKDYYQGFGSNAWAAGQDATRSGSIVAGDGHLQLSVPSLMYQIGLDTKTLGQGTMQQAGLMIGGIPVMAVGTNGNVAWSQVNPVVDITDWYLEEIQLNADGMPNASYFQDAWQDLTRVSESIEIADRPALDSVGRTFTWDQLITFDGRRLYEVEGREVTTDEVLLAGESKIYIQGKWIVPSDQDQDGIIHAISFDYAAFDATGFIDALIDIGESESISEFKNQTKRFVGGGLFSAAGDKEGNILYTSYQGVPCRSYLDRDAQGRWAQGHSPMYILDGKTVGGFTIPTDAEGYVDESQADQASHCVIPFDLMPLDENPSRGYVFTANNDPQGFADDGRVDNDEWYIGGPWSIFRGDTIKRSLEDSKSDGEIDIADMQNIQANIESRLGELFVPHLLDTLQQVETWDTMDDLSESQTAVLTLWQAHQTELSQAQEYLRAWADRGYHAHSGVETFYNTVTETESDNAVSTMIFNVFLRQFLPAVWSDEAVGSIPYHDSRITIYALDRMLRGRGADNPQNLLSWDPDTQESIFFDRVESEVVETSHLLLVQSLVQAITELSRTRDENGYGFGSDEMSTWIWGLRHQARFESILGPFLGNVEGAISLILNQFSITTSKLPLFSDLMDDDPRSELTHFPRGGDQWAVDAANPGLRGGNFTFSNGPVMRMVIHLDQEGVEGYNIVPGGQSGLTSSNHFYDQLKLWLANETYPLRFSFAQVMEGAEKRWRFEP